MAKFLCVKSYRISRLNVVEKHVCNAVMFSIVHRVFHLSLDQAWLETYLAAVKSPLSELIWNCVHFSSFNRKLDIDIVP